MMRKVKYLALVLAVGGAMFQCGCPCGLPKLCGLPKGCELFRLVALWLQEDLFS